MIDDELLNRLANDIGFTIITLTDNREQVNRVNKSNKKKRKVKAGSGGACK